MKQLMLINWKKLKRQAKPTTMKIPCPRCGIPMLRIKKRRVHGGICYDYQCPQSCTLDTDTLIVRIVYLKSKTN